jgi:hypothetical protein
MQTLLIFFEIVPFKVFFNHDLTLHSILIGEDDAISREDYFHYLESLLNLEDIWTHLDKPSTDMI